MKKMIYAAILPLLGIAALAGCSQSAAPKTSALHSEVVSAAILFNPGMQQKAASVKRAAAPAEEAVAAKLAAFEALDFANYRITSEIIESPRSDYPVGEKLTYTNASGASESIYLYSGASEKVTTSFGPTGVEASSAQDASSALESEDAEEEDEAKRLHEFGLASGAYEDLLESDMEIDDYDDEETGTKESLYKKGIAIIAGKEYAFASEQLHIVAKEEDGEEETLDYASFGLYAGKDFLTVEQFEVVEEGEKDNAYAFTSYFADDLEHVLLVEDDEETRYASLHNDELIAITRFEENDKTLFAFYEGKKGTLTLTGLYEKVITTSSAGSELVSYLTYDGTVASLPEED
jgi:hypothetical protein